MPVVEGNNAERCQVSFLGGQLSFTFLAIDLFGGADVEENKLASHVFIQGVAFVDGEPTRLYRLKHFDDLGVLLLIGFKARKNNAQLFTTEGQTKCSALQMHFIRKDVYQTYVAEVIRVSGIDIREGDELQDPCHLEEIARKLQGTILIYLIIPIYYYRCSYYYIDAVTEVLKKKPNGEALFSDDSMKIVNEQEIMSTVLTKATSAQPDVIEVNNESFVDTTIQYFTIMYYSGMRSFIARCATAGIRDDQHPKVTNRSTMSIEQYDDDEALSDEKVTTSIFFHGNKSGTTKQRQSTRSKFPTKDVYRESLEAEAVQKKKIKEAEKRKKEAEKKQLQHQQDEEDKRKKQLQEKEKSQPKKQHLQIVSTRQQMEPAAKNKVTIISSAISDPPNASFSFAQNLFLQEQEQQMVQQEMTRRLKAEEIEREDRRKRQLLLEEEENQAFERRRKLRIEKEEAEEEKRRAMMRKKEEEDRAKEVARQQAEEAENARRVLAETARWMRETDEAEERMRRKRRLLQEEKDFDEEMERRRFNAKLKHDLEQAKMKQEAHKALMEIEISSKEREMKFKMELEAEREFKLKEKELQLRFEMQKNKELSREHRLEDEDRKYQHWERIADTAGRKSGRR